MINRYFIIVSYYGLFYNGWQKQNNNKNTIEEILEKKINIILKKKINIISCSRTDKGVNAFSMYVHFDLKIILNFNNILVKLNNILPSYIFIKKIFMVNNNIHARYSAKYRSYIYIISFKKNPFLWKKSFFIYNKINFNKLLIITKIININNNFYSFTSNKYYNNNCYIKYIKWFFLKNNILIFYIKANRYLKYMIRCIIGIILKISLNKKNFFFFFKCFKKKKKFLKYLIPSYGLYLLNVEY